MLNVSNRPRDVGVGVGVDTTSRSASPPSRASASPTTIDDDTELGVGRRITSTPSSRRDVNVAELFAPSSNIANVESAADGCDDTRYVATHASAVHAHISARLIRIACAADARRRRAGADGESMEETRDAIDGTRARDAD